MEREESKIERLTRLAIARDIALHTAVESQLKQVEIETEKLRDTIKQFKKQTETLQEIYTMLVKEIDKCDLYVGRVMYEGQQIILHYIKVLKTTAPPNK